MEWMGRKTRTKKRIVGLTCVVTLNLFLLNTSAAFAQLPTATVLGVVKDATGAVVPEANLTARNTETGQTRSAVSAADGSYRFSALAVGSYEIRAEHSGFQAQVRNGLVLTVAQEAVVNLILEVGNVEQQVTVTAEAPIVNATLSPTSGLVGEKEVKDLPLNGRSFDLLLTLNAGTTNFTSNRTIASGGNLFSVAGRRPEENRFLMNGVDYIGTSQSTNTITPNGASGEVLGVDAVREFNVVQHTYGAEYGKRAGAQIGILTSSGTNQLHGDAFEYLRNSVLDSRNFFDYPLGTSIPPFKRNQFGGSLGGPIKKDKVFLFGNYEGFRQRLGVSAVAVVPDANARQGLLPNAQGVPTPVAGLKPGMLPFANNFWPAPNGPVLGGGLAYAYANPVQKVIEDFGLVRFDYNVSEKDSFSANYLMDTGENDLPNPDPNFYTQVRPSSQLFGFQETHVFSPALLNVATLGFSRARTPTGSLPAVPIPSSLLFVTGNPPGAISIGGTASGFGSSSITNAGGNRIVHPVRNFFTGADDLHYIKGNHSLSFGLWIQRIRQNMDASGGPTTSGTISYPTLQAFLTDSPTVFIAIPHYTMLGYRSTEAAWYVQDEIKLRPNLTLRLGLRDEMTTGWNEVKDRCANYVYDANGVILTDPLIGPSCLTQNNAIALWQPRVGLAWDPTGAGTWAVRAGFGIYNDLLENLGQQFISNPPFAPRMTLAATPLLSIIPIPGGTPPPPSCSPTQGQPCSTFAAGGVDPNTHTPTVQEWSFTVERGIAKDLMLQLGYVGSQAYHTPVTLDINAPQHQVCSDPQGCVSGGTLGPVGRVPQGTTYIPPGTRPNPYVASNSVSQFREGTTSYHALNVSLVKRPSHGLRFKANYTFSKVLDLNSGVDNGVRANDVNGILDPYNLALSKGPAAYNVRHQFNTNFTYELPFGSGRRWGGGASGFVDKLIGGWQWNSILTAQTGFPFTPSAGSNRSGTGDTNNPDVPNRNPAFSGPVILGTPNKWFNPNAFLLPIAGTFGNVGRGSFTGPGLTTWDTSLFKKFSITERWSLQFRAEFFNILNHTNFGEPNPVVFSGTNISPSAGGITSTATTSRQIQFALKIIF